MKSHRFAVSAIGVAIAAASVLGMSAPALAATPGVTYVTAADFVSTNTAGTAGWTTYGLGTLTSSVSGLAIPNGTIASYGVAPILATTGSAVTDFARASTYSSSSSLGVISGITLFDTNGVDDLIYSFNGAASFSDPTSQWFPTNAIGSLSGAFTLAELDAELSTEPSVAGWTIRSFSLETTTDATLYTATVNGQLFSFLPQPVVSAAPTTIAQAALAATGVTVTTTGFLPNEPIEFSLDGGTSSSAGTAGVGGAFSVTRTAAAASAGSHTIVLRGTTSGVAQSFAFTVTAPAVVTPVVVPPAAPALAATGGNTGTPAGIAAGGLLVLLGSALVFIAPRRGRRALH